MGNHRPPLCRYLDATLDWATNPAWSCNGKSQSPIAINSKMVQSAPTSAISDLERAFVAALPLGLLGNVSNLTLANERTWTWCHTHQTTTNNIFPQLAFR